MRINKKKTYKIIIICFLVMAIILPFIIYSCSSNNVDNTEMKANKYTMDAVIDDYGDMHVVERINIVNNANDNNYFYREIAYNKNNMFGNSYNNKASLKDVKFVVEENNAVVYDSSDSSYYDYPKHFAGFSFNNDKDERGDYIRCENSQKNCDMIFYYHKSGFAKEMTFIYEYTIKGVITQYKDISELNWVMLDYQPIKVKNVTINITLPNGDYNIENMKTFFHGSNVANREFVGNNKIKITADSMVSDEQIEVRLLLNNDIFSNVRSENKVNINALNSILNFENDQITKANLKYRVGYIGVIIIFVIFLVLIGLMTFRCYKKYDKEFPTDFMNDYHMELPAEYSPAVMSYLYKFREIDDDDLSATLLDLVRRKYLILDDNNSGINDKNPNYIIKLNTEKDQGDLLEYEKFLIKWFIEDIGSDNQVSANQIKSYCDSVSGAEEYKRNSVRWNSLVAKEGKKYKFFDETIKSAKIKYSNIGTLLIICSFVFLSLISSYSGYILGYSLMASVLLVGVSFVLYVNSFDRRSKSGNEDFVRWRAFKKFLEDFSNFKEYPVTSIILWEHYLVYATSFGIADKVMEQLKLKLDLNDITEQTTFVTYFGYYHPINCINSSVRGMRTAYMATIAKQTAQRVGGGSGRSGGFSGGSSFGGGGGSFGGGHR